MEKRNKNVNQSEENIEKDIKSKNKIKSPYNYKSSKDLFIQTPKIYKEIQEELFKQKEHNFILEDINDNNEEIKEIYDIINNQNKIGKIEKKSLLPLFKKTNIKDFLKSDLLFTGLEINDLIEFMNPYVSLKKYNFCEFIYSYKDPAENIYLILNGNIGLYKLVETEENFTSEQYYYYIYNKYIQFKQVTINKKGNSENNLFENDEFIDLDSIIKNININKSIFPLYSLDDIPELNKILLSIKLYIKFLENQSGKISELYQQFNMPFDFLNFDKFAKNKISFTNFMDELSKNIKDREKFYMKYLGENEKYQIKIIKFIKYKNLKNYNYFGNFEIIDTKAFRKGYAICENDVAILLAINKKEYSKIVNKSQKARRKKEIDFLHNNFFKTINRPYFESKIFIKFEIDQFFRGHVLSKQGEKINNFIFIEEGVIESSINDISLLEFPEKIRALSDFIINKAKEYSEDPKTIIDFEIKINQKTNVKYELIEDLLKKKQNFTISKTTKGNIGDYQFFFDVPSFISSTVISKNNRIFFYDFQNFRKVNEETRAFNETLKRISFYKLKSILKRMISIYNSYFSFTVKMVEDKLNSDNSKIENENKLNSNNKLMNNNNSIEIEKNYSSPFSNVNNTKININNFMNTISEINSSKTNLENIFANNKNKINTIFSKIKYKGKRFYNLASDYHLYENDTTKSNLMTVKTKNILNMKNSIFLSLNTSFNNNKEKISIKKLKINKLNDNKRKKLIHSVGHNNYYKLKSNNEVNNKILEIFLPPLKSKDETSKPKVLFRNTIINNKNMRHALETTNSINDVSLGHKERSNFDEHLLTNYDIKKSKKSKSIDVKKAQILLLKNRDKKAKLILQKKNDSEFLYDEDFF